MSNGSFPSSPYYTPRKSSQVAIHVNEDGVLGDYNHYRTVVMQSTGDRALSILTSDVGSYVRGLDGGYYASSYRDGDLGENLLVDGVDMAYFEVGRRYRFSSSSSSSSSLDGDIARGIVDALSSTTDVGVIVEITEPIVPCGNLCRLPYVVDPRKMDPRERVARCQYFLESLGRKEGLRGWYAKVLHGGMVKVGDTVTAVSLAPAAL